MPRRSLNPDCGADEQKEMSALGQKQTFRQVSAMSALPPKADIRGHGWNVRFVPIADISQPLFDQLIGAARQGQWNGYAERLGGLKIDDQFDFGNLLDRQVGGLFALEDTAGVDASLTECLRSSSGRQPRQTREIGRPWIPRDGLRVRRSAPSGY